MALLLPVLAACAEISGLDDFEASGMPPAVCGDGIRQGEEACDDGNTEDGDGCSSTCVVVCPSGWIESDAGHCYLIEDDLSGWEQATTLCEAYGSLFHLATITDLDELTFVQGTAARSIWLGGTDMGVGMAEGNWRWDNEEPWTWVNGMVPPWATAQEPNDQNGNEDCLELDLGARFNDSVCTLMMPRLCELTPPSNAP